MSDRDGHDIEPIGVRLRQLASLLDVSVPEPPSPPATSGTHRRIVVAAAALVAATVAATAVVRHQPQSMHHFQLSPAAQSSLAPTDDSPAATSASTEHTNTIVSQTDPSSINSPPAQTSEPPPVSNALSLFVPPVIDLDGCTPRISRSGPYSTDITQLFGRQPPASFEVIGDRGGSFEKPFAIALRYTTGTRLSPSFTSDLQINGQPAKVDANGTSGRIALSWPLPDGSEAYLRSDTYTLEQLIELAQALTARPLDSAIPGFDIDANANNTARDAAVLDQNAGPFQAGTLAMSECAFPNGPSVRASVLGPRQLWQAAYLLDRPSSAALVIDLGDGRLLAMTGSGTVTTDLLADAAKHVHQAVSPSAPGSATTTFEPTPTQATRPSFDPSHTPIRDRDGNRVGWIDDTNEADIIYIPLPESYTSLDPLYPTAIGVRIVRDDNGRPVGIFSGLGFIPGALIDDTHIEPTIQQQLINDAIANTGVTTIPPATATTGS
jgi:hypothetical protein